MTGGGRRGEVELIAAQARDQAESRASSRGLDGPGSNSRSHAGVTRRVARTGPSSSTTHSRRGNSSSSVEPFLVQGVLGGK